MPKEVFCSLKKPDHNSFKNLSNGNCLTQQTVLWSMLKGISADGGKFREHAE